jgi:hypothetical protein
MFSLKSLFIFFVLAFSPVFVSGAQKSQYKPVSTTVELSTAKVSTSLQLKHRSETCQKRSDEKIEAESTGAKPSGSRAASAHVSKPTNHEVFESIKTMITQSHCRVKDWKTFDSLDYTNKVLQTNCYTSARYLVCALTKEKDADLLNRYVDLSESDASLSQKFKQSEKLLDTEFHGLHTDFVTKGKSKGIGDCLFTAATKAEHVLFYIAPNPWKHAYVIKKLSDGKATQWKVYQSLFILIEKIQ